MGGRTVSARDEYFAAYREMQAARRRADEAEREAAEMEHLVSFLSTGGTAAEWRAFVEIESTT